MDEFVQFEEQFENTQTGKLEVPEVARNQGNLLSHKVSKESKESKKSKKSKVKSQSSDLSGTKQFNNVMNDF